jgi:hypothetical protein
LCTARTTLQPLLTPAADLTQRLSVNERARTQQLTKSLSRRSCALIGKRSVSLGRWLAASQCCHVGLRAALSSSTPHPTTSARLYRRRRPLTRRTSPHTARVMRVSQRGRACSDAVAHQPPDTGSHRGLVAPRLCSRARRAHTALTAAPLQPRTRRSLYSARPWRESRPGAAPRNLSRSTAQTDSVLPPRPRAALQRWRTVGPVERAGRALCGAPAR